MSLVTRLKNGGTDWLTGESDAIGISLANWSATAPTQDLPLAAGDMVVVICGISGYRIPTGDTGFDPARLVLPSPRWSHLSHRVTRQGSLPGVIGEVMLVLALNATAADVATPSWVVKVYGQSPAPVPRPNQPKARAWLFRGEVAVSDVTWSQNDVPTYSHQTVPGWSPSGVGLLARVVDNLNRDSSYFLASNDTPENNASYVTVWDGDVTSTPTPPALTVYTRRYYSGSASIQTTSPVVAVSATATTVVAPLHPTILEPADGSMLDMQALPHTLRWRHVNGVAGAQTGYQIIKTVAGVDLYLRVDTGAWVSSPWTNAGTAQEAVLPAGSWAHGMLARVEVATVGQSGSASRRSEPVWITSVPAPIAGVQVVGVSGGLVADMTPTVVVSSIIAYAGAALTAWEAQLVDVGTGLIVASGTGTSAGVWDPGYQAAHMQVLRARVRVQQTGGEWSLWAEQTVTVNVTTPGIPTVTATPWRHPVSNAPGQQLTVAFPDDAYPWPTATTRLAIWRTGDDGVPVLITDAVMPAGQRTATRYDYAAPTGQTVRYSARGTGVTPDGGTLIGQAGVSADTDQAAEGCWVVDPAAPEAAVLAHIASDSDRSVGQRTVLRPLGSPAAVVVDGGPTLESGTVTFQSGSAEHRARLMGLLNAGRVLLLRWPVEVDWDGGDPHAPDVWLRVSGPVVVERPVRGPYQYRTVQVPWVGTPPVVAG